MKISAPISLLILLLHQARGFSPVSTPSRRHRVTAFRSAVSDDKSTLPGVANFEEWFRSNIDGENGTLKNVRHGSFSNGRGLEFIGNMKDLNGSDKAVIELPKEFVLQSVIVDDKELLESSADDWDSVLSGLLLRECQLGKDSEIYGYCNLLSRGQEWGLMPCPPSTAPDCIRNWTEEQKDVLRASKRGARLVRIQENQAKEWKEKYDELPSEEKNSYTEEQFYWAMEAVNSRAFKGDYGGEDLASKLSKALIPFAAGAFGLNLIAQGSNPFASDERLTIVLLILSCAPIVLSFVSENFGMKTMDAVLLPFIDSANHDETARTNIQFDPLKGKFTVTAEGKSCIKEEDGKSKQFYITYGEKRDTELLLNYGFLNSFDSVASESEDDRRRRLADTFNARAV